MAGSVGRELSFRCSRPASVGELRFGSLALYLKISQRNSPSGIWSIYNNTEKISMAPALRMTHANKEKQTVFCLIPIRY